MPISEAIVYVPSLRGQLSSHLFFLRVVAVFVSSVALAPFRRTKSDADARLPLSASGQRGTPRRCLHGLLGVKAVEATEHSGWQQSYPVVVYLDC